MNEQAEARYFAAAMRIIRRAQEDALQDQAENEEARRARRRAGRKKANRKLWDKIAHRADANKIPRPQVSDIIEAALHKLQKSLRRYNLSQRTHATFSLRCTENEFISLLQGYGEIRGMPGRYKACLVGFSAKETLQKLSKMLGNPTPRKWVPRRYYGKITNIERDCSYIKLDMKERRKAAIIFEYKEEKTYQIDRDGVEHVTSMGKLICKYPRSVSAVQAKKVIIYNANQHYFN